MSNDSKSKKIPLHTAGDWEAKLGQFDYCSNDGCRPILARKKDEDGNIEVIRICSVDSVIPRKRSTPYDAPDDERDANARLIEAAPSLLRSLEEMTERIESVHALTEWNNAKLESMSIASISRAKAAIAKAYGNKDESEEV